MKPTDEQIKAEANRLFPVVRLSVDRCFDSNAADRYNWTKGAEYGYNLAKQPDINAEKQPNEVEQDTASQFSWLSSKKPIRDEASQLKVAMENNTKVYSTAHRNEVQEIVFDFEGAIVITNKQLCDIVPKGICAYRAQFIITSDMPSYKELCEQILNGKKVSQAEGSDAVEFAEWIINERNHNHLICDYSVYYYLGGDGEQYNLEKLHKIFTQQKHTK